MMKKLLMVAAAALVVGNVGCNNTPPGGPGATGNTSRTGVGQPDNTFELTLPKFETDIKQGETKTVSIGISREKNFDQDVRLQFSGAPQGVKVTPASPELKASAKEVPVSIEAAKDAALGEHTITVTGTPVREGPKTSGTFKIQVKKPD